MVESCKGISHEEMVQKYASASVAVVPSIYEGFGLPAVEAMACGVPLVSTDGGALAEVVEDAGLVVPAGDSEALAAAIRQLFEDDQLRDDYASRGLSRAEQHFVGIAVLNEWKPTIRAYRRMLTVDFDYFDLQPGHVCVDLGCGEGVIH